MSESPAATAPSTAAPPAADSQSPSPQRQRRRKPKFSEYQQGIGSIAGKTGAALLEARSHSVKKDLQRSTVFDQGKPFEGQSLSRIEFKAFPDARPPPSCKPQVSALESEPEDRDFKTVARSSFINLGYARRQPIKPPVSAMETGGKFDATSTMRSDYIHFAGARPSESAKPILTQREEVPENRDFKTESSSIGAVKNYPKPPLAHPPAAVPIETGPFQATSTMREDFQYQPTKPPKSFKPVQQREITEETRDFKTTQGSTIGSPQGKTGAAILEARARSTKPDLQRSSVFDMGQRFEGQSLTRAEFKAFPGARPSSSAKPVATALETGPEDRDFKTVASSSFINLGYARRQPIKPPVKALETGGKFDATSTTRADYIHFVGARPAESAKPVLNKREEVPEDRTFETDKAAFHKPFRGDFRSPSAKPALSKSVLTPDGENRDFLTETRVNYTPKRNEYRNEAAEIRAKVKGGQTRIYDDDPDEWEEV